MKRKQTFAQWTDNLATMVFMFMALWHGMLHGRYDAGIFWVLCAILAQLPPRSLWRK